MRKQDKVTIENSMDRIDLRARVRKVMVEAMENICKVDECSAVEIVLHIQNHLTDKGFEVVKIGEPESGLDPTFWAQVKNA